MERVKEFIKLVAGNIGRRMVEWSERDKIIPIQAQISQAIERGDRCMSSSSSRTVAR